MSRDWWRDAVLYQVYPRSFVDSNGDGIGDLPGVTSRLEYLEWLGVDGIWLNPTFPSPNADWGYDVADYTGVHPDLGTLDDLDRLVEEAGRRGIRILLDIVPGHSSDRNAWFEEARSSRESRRRTWYVWADGRSDGHAPNDLESVFDGPAWELDRRTGQYYLHTFLAEQPELNWRNAEVGAEFDRILRFWFDRGIAGFRIDVAHRIVKDEGVADPGAGETVTLDSGRSVKIPAVDRDATHEVLRSWRELADGFDGPARILVGETYVLDVDDLATYYGNGVDELHLAFNFVFAHAPFAPAALAGVVAATEAALPREAWPVWTGSNHDIGRLASRWCGGDERKARCALLALLMLRGTPVLYYGDELALPNVDVPRERLQDPVGIRRWPEEPGRDRGRTPMHWSPEPGAGFTSAPERAWLPIGDNAACNVEDQRRDQRSVVNLCRDAIALRRELHDLRRADYAPLRTDAGVWAWRRGADAVVALNLRDEPASIGDVRGTIALTTTREREGVPVEDGLALGPWEGAVVVERRAR